MAPKNLVNIDSGNGLMPDGTKPLPTLINDQWGLVVRGYLTGTPILDDNFKIANLKLQAHLAMSSTTKSSVEVVDGKP